MTFSESMKKSTLTTSTVRLVKKGTTTKVAATVSYTNATCKTVVLNSSANLARGTAYTATITTAAKDLAGNSLARNKVWSFTVKR